MTTAAALDALANKLAGIERTRSPVEAPRAKTDAYVDLLFGIGYARVGEAERAHERFHAARAKLEPWARDPVHELLVAAFSARLDLVLAGNPHEVWPADMLARFDTGTNRVSRYKVERLREFARLLDPDGAKIDAIGRHNPRNAIASPKPVPALSPQPNDRELHDYFDAAAPAIDLGDDLARAVDALVAMPDASIDTYSAAAVAMWREGWPELVDTVIRAFETSSARATGIDVPTVLILLTRATGPRDTAARGPALDAIRRMASSCPPQEILDLASVIAHEESRPNANRTLTVTESVGRTRIRASGTRGRPPDVALAELLILAEGFRDITDSFGTNSHFCLLVLQFVDALVWPLVDRETR